MARYVATGELARYSDAMTPESSVKEWGLYLMAHYFDVAGNQLTLEGARRFFCLETHYNHVVRDNPARQKTATVYRFISGGFDLLMQELCQLGLIAIQ